MNRQKTLANASTFEKYKKPTKREKFLAEMERVVPWKELYALIEPFYGFVNANLITRDSRILTTPVILPRPPF